MSKEGYFLVSTVKKFRGFRDNAKWFTAPFPSSGEWNNAERAHVITAPHNGNEGGNSIGIQADGVYVRVSFLTGKEDVYAFVATIRISDKLRQGTVCIRADNHIDQTFLFQ